MSAEKRLPLYEVLAIRMGTRRAAKSAVYLNYSLYGREDAGIDVDYYFWVLRSEDRIVIVDSGFSEEGGRKRERTMLLHPRDALTRLGIDPLRVTDVIVTHGHYDHIGNIDLFSNSRIHMAASEYAFWTSPLAERLQFSYYSESREIEVLRQAKAEGRLQLFEDSLDPCVGVRIVRVGGHTPGQAMVYAKTSDGTVLLASDALHFYEELQQDMPFSAMCDLPAMYEAFDRIRAEEGVAYDLLIAGHDRKVLEGFPHVAALPEGTGVVISRPG